MSLFSSIMFVRFFCFSPSIPIQTRRCIWFGFVICSVIPYRIWLLFSQFAQLVPAAHSLSNTHTHTRHVFIKFDSKCIYFLSSSLYFFSVLIWLSVFVFSRCVAFWRISVGSSLPIYDI